MTNRRVAPRASRTRTAWLVFWSASALAVVACFVTVLDASNLARASLALVGGLVVVGVAALFVDWIVSGLAPPGDGGSRSSAVTGASLGGAGLAAGGFDGGGGGAGCGHGGGAPGC